MASARSVAIVDRARRVGRFAARHRASLGIAAAVALALALFFGFVALNHLDDGALRSYPKSTDDMPARETELFIAMMFLGGGALVGLAILFSRHLGDRLVGWVTAGAARPRRTLLILAGFALVATALVSWLALQHAPILLDEQLYLFQTRLIAAGRLSTDIPDPLGPFRDNYSVQTRGVWTGIYPWGHAAVLLPGLLIGLPQLVPHLCAPAAVLLVYWLGREIFPEDRVTPLIASLVVATSPFIAFTCGTMHNSTTSMVLMTASLASLVRACRRSTPAFAALAGLCFGLGLHSRAYNAVAIAVPAGIVALVYAVRERRRPLRLAVAFALGLVPGVALYLGLDYLITGDVFLTPAHISMPPDMKIFGFGPKRTQGVLHTPINAFGKVATNLMRLLLWTGGSLVIALGLGGLVLGIRRRQADLLLLVPVAGLFGFYYFFYTSPGYDTGPLYYLDLVPILALMFGRFVVALADRAPEPTRFVRRASSTWLAAFVVALVTWWPLEGISAHRVTSNTLLPYRVAEENGVHNAIVWFNANRQHESWTLPPPPPRPDLSDDVIFARYGDSWAKSMWDKYKGKRLFYRLHTETKPAWMEPWVYIPRN